MSDYSLTHQCPQCGAPVELEETDRIFTCPFCQVRLFIHANGPMQYFFPPRISHPGTLFYVPYWRFRGSAFVIEHQSVRHKILDANILAIDCNPLPVSVGLRSQAIPLHFVEPDTQGVFLQPTVKASTFKNQLLRSIPGIEAQNAIRLTACVGELMSVIFQPVFQDEHVIDGLTGASIGKACLSESAGSHIDPGLHFFSTLCPQCGWDVHGERCSLVQTCPQCHTAWEPGPEGGTQIPVRFFVHDEPTSRYLPFWNLHFRATGFALQTWADLIRLTNLPKVVLPWMESKAFTFRVPAFKIKPELFLSLASRVSIFQPSTVRLESFPQEALHPVTLSSKEAFHALPVVLGNLTPARKMLFERIAGGRLSPIDAELEYLPFTEDNTEFMQPEMNMAIQKSALYWSSAL